MSSLFIALDTLIRGLILIGFFFGGWYLYHEARQGFPSLNNPNHQYNDDMEPEQCEDFSCGKCIACESYEAYREGEYKKYCGCDKDFQCYCEFYEEYK